MIPSPTEPKLTVNSFISPLVDELLELWKGVQIPKQDSVLGNFTIRAALCYVCCDLPATRKLCGFYSFKALKGCSKCLKSFQMITMAIRTTLGSTKMIGNLEILLLILFVHNPGI